MIIEILLLIVNLAILGGAVLVYRRINTRIKSMFTAPDPETPSEFAQVIDQGARILVSRAVEFLGMHDKAQASAAVRREGAVDKAMITDLLSSHPVGAILAAKFPSLVRAVQKNPALLPFAMDKLQNFKLPGGSNGQEKEVTISGNDPFNL